MIERLMNDTSMKFFSVVLAVVIWLMVYNINDPYITKRFSDVKVTVVNEDVLTDLGYSYVIKEGDKVSFTVKGRRSIVDRLTASDFQAKANFAKLSDVYAVPIDVTATKYGDRVEIYLGTTNTMIIEREKISTISMAVEVKVNGKAADGYAIGKTTSTPNLVTVTGPSSELKNVKEIRAYVDKDNFTESFTAKVNLGLYDDQGLRIDSSQIKMNTEEVTVSVDVWKTKTVDVSLEYSGEPAEGYELVSFDYEPKEVKVTAPASVLKKLDTIYLKKVYLDGKTESYEGTRLLSDAFEDEDMKAVDDTTEIKFKATIEKTVSRTLTFKSGDITVKGKKNRKVFFDDANKYSLMVSGASSVVKAVKIKDFDPWIDVTDMEEGRHEVTVHVKEVDGITVEETASIIVTLEE